MNLVITARRLAASDHRWTGLRASNGADERPIPNTAGIMAAANITAPLLASSAGQPWLVRFGLMLAAYQARGMTDGYGL